MIILGVNSFFAHPAVAIVQDGELVFALEQERVTRVKRGRQYAPYKTHLPYESICAALTHTGLRFADIDEIAYSHNPWAHVVASCACLAGKRPSSLRDELAAFTNVLNIKRKLQRPDDIPPRHADILAPFDFATRTRFRNWDHHLSHAASAFFCSGFDESLVIVADGSAQRACTSIYAGEGGVIRRVASVPLSRSPGFFYSLITAHLGFEPSTEEYKVMELAAYGKDRYLHDLRHALGSASTGRYRIDMSRLTQLEFILGDKRMPCETIMQRHMDIACSAQTLLEQTLLDVLSSYLQQTGLRKLCAAGSVFLNCAANGRIARLPGLDDYFVQPAAHDAGTAIGAAALSAIRLGAPPQLRYASMSLGTEYRDGDIIRALAVARLCYRQIPHKALPTALARLLANGKIVALFRGRMAFGPSTLGRRGLLASPNARDACNKLNAINGYEHARPLAPLIREEDYNRFFEGPANRHMMFAVRARPETLQVAPAVVHADNTARAGIVRQADEPFLHETLSCFYEATGVPMLVNASLNVCGQPIDESPSDAICSFLTSSADALLIGNCLVER
ncbi:hypothetical protein LJR230_004909 [Trinickia sp. LjRoot230]|uniref:carbamoyltransferase family protein n=1 Tax=Trinickia sp. LjRoot230 TaxID=3342288 RepID=UPI003ED12FB4